MRSRMVDKSAEACGSQMRLVFAERPNEFVGEVQHVDNKRIPVEYHKHNTPINDAYHVMKKFDHLPFLCLRVGIRIRTGLKILRLYGLGVQIPPQVPTI